MVELIFFVLTIVLIVCFFSRKNEKCPFCAEKIKKGATVCRHCGREIPVTKEFSKSKTNASGSGIESGRNVFFQEIKSNKQSLFLFLSCVFMFIPVLLSLFTYHYHYIGHIFFVIPKHKVEDVIIHPDVITTMYAVFMYSSLLVRGIVDIDLKTEKTPILVMRIVLLSLNVLFIASFLSIFVNAKTFLGVSSQALFIFAIALSWLGVKSIAGYVWVLLFLLSLGNISKINEAMGLFGAIYVLSAFISIAFQFIPNNKFSELAQAFKSDFKVAKTEIQEDLSEAKKTTEKIIKASAGAAVNYSSASNGTPVFSSEKVTSDLVEKQE